MPALPITTSPNIASLDSLIVADLCAGYFYIDFSPTIYIGSGESNLLGGKIQITNPYNVVTRAFPTSYDVAPAFSGGMDAVTQIVIPTQDNNYQYGVYKIEVQLTDADGTKYTLAKTVSICQPNSLDKTKKYGTLGAKLSGICSAGKLVVKVDSEPAYNGIIPLQFDRSLRLDYPTGSGRTSEINVSQPSFAVVLFEGVYKISGTSCAYYNYGDNVTVKVPYKVNYDKPILCSLDEGCVFSALDGLNQKLISDCSDEEKKQTQDTINQAGLLLNAIDFGIRDGQDVSEFISQLEIAIGQPCACNFDSPTPIINQNPTNDFIVQGCNVDSETVGLTTTFTVNAYSYEATITPNGGVFTVSDVVLNGCVQSQIFTFNVTAIYNQVKGQAASDAPYWASIIKIALNGLDTSCLNISSSVLPTLTLEQLVQSILNKACEGGNCDATIDTYTATQSGGSVNVSWTQTGSFAVDVYLDSIYVSTVLSSKLNYTFIGASDGNVHTYTLIPKCANGSNGTGVQSTFGFSGCASISPPVLSSPTFYNAACPFDLTSTTSSFPAGINAEWHTANNTLLSSLVTNPTDVTDGTYYVFATDGSGCYSTGVKLILTCAVSSSCSAPQNLSAAAIIGGVKVSFQSAAYPPPSNSYTVKRKPQAAADVSGSYVTVGTPTFNVSTNKWEITDSLAVANTYYTYKAISNCTSGTPNILLDYANINCPTLTVTSDSSTISYSFTDSGGEIDEYRVELYDSTGMTLIDSDTYLSPSGTISGLFDYLTTGTNYKIRIVAFIGYATFPCAFTTKATTVLTPSITQLSNVDSGGGTRTQVFQIGANVTAGNTFYVEVYSHQVSIIAVGGDTPTTIATKLKNAVNATTTTQWNSASAAPTIGTAGYPPTATSTTDQLTIVLDYPHQFAAGAY